MRSIYPTIPNKPILFLGLLFCLFNGSMTLIFSFLLSRLLFFRCSKCIDDQPIRRSCFRNCSSRRCIPRTEILCYVLYASTRVTFHFILRHSCHLFVLPVMSPSFPSLLRHRRLFVLLTVCYRLLSSLRLSSFVYSFVTDLFRPFYVPSIIPRICGYAIIV